MRYDPADISKRVQALTAADWTHLCARFKERMRAAGYDLDPEFYFGPGPCPHPHKRGESSLWQICGGIRCVIHAETPSDECAHCDRDVGGATLEWAVVRAVDDVMSGRHDPSRMH